MWGRFWIAFVLAVGMIIWVAALWFVVIHQGPMPLFRL
jgi:hypothetical protein